eukprot:CAMPEP_0114529718 /NCGR_PEP_ID=MMETSP0109-20121206/25016_1 /TAXON_ID=29199 /ORGANISM="Chlorarachnion reptans, Strain CCCM449" /LENGTH=465 /DNA_ID=CAMNT_0001712203 /DNA_START=38 /DNA_END=1436 /DNA_ORIENTATION=-
MAATLSRGGSSGEVEAAASHLLNQNIGSPVQLERALAVLRRIVENILRRPGEMRFRRIPLGNRRIREAFAGMDGIEGVFLSLGFSFVEADKKYVVLEDSVDPSAQFPSALKLIDSSLSTVAELKAAGLAVAAEDLARLQIGDGESKRANSAGFPSEGATAMQDASAAPTPQPATSTPSSSSSTPRTATAATAAATGGASRTAKGPTNGLNAAEYQRQFGIKKRSGGGSRDPKASAAPQIRVRRDNLPDRDSMAKLVEHRLKNRGKTRLGKRATRAGGAAGGGIRKGNVREFRIPVETKESLIPQGGSKKHYTASELEGLARERYEHPSHFGNVKDMDYIGRLMLDHTNEFRKKHSLPPVYWSQEIANISRVHSKAMGDKKVKFGHDGFKGRVKQFRKVGIYHRSAAENVAMNGGLSYANTARATEMDGSIPRAIERTSFQNQIIVASVCTEISTDNTMPLKYLPM